MEPITIDPEVAKLLLNGMSFKHFLVYFMIGMIGALMFFLGNLYSAIKTDTGTPFKWSWKAFMKGGIRVLLSLTSLAFSIIYFKEISPFLFNITGDGVVDVNGFSALCLGIGIDRLWKGVLHVGHESIKAKSLTLRAIIIFLLLLMSSGCVTQKRCLDKFPPITSVDTIKVPGEPIYIDTIIYRDVPGDTIIVDTTIIINESGEIEFTEVFAETELATAHAWIELDRLRLELNQKDSLFRFKLDSAIRENTDTVKIIHKEVVEVPKIPKSFPYYRFGFFLFLGLVLFYVTIKALKK